MTTATVILLVIDILYPVGWLLGYDHLDLLLWLGIWPFMESLRQTARRHRLDQEGTSR